MTQPYDIYIEITDSPASKYPFSFGANESTTQFMTGFYGSIFKWVKCFLTVPGTNLSDKEYGTVLASMAGSVGMDYAALADVVRMSVASATRKILSYQGEYTMPEDEKLQSVTLVSVEQPQVDQVKIVVAFTNATNTKAVLRLPFDIVPTIERS